MSVISLDFRIPNDNRPHIKVDVVYDGGQKKTTLVALADTGAQSCFISNEKAEELRLPILGKSQIRGSAGEVQTNVYKIDFIVLPNSVTYKKSGIVGYTKCGAAADIILGMDLLGCGFFSISFDGKMLFAL